MIENLAIIHRAHPVVRLSPHLLVVRHLLVAHPRVPHLVQIRIVGAKICRRVVAQVIVEAQLEMSVQAVKPVIHAGFGQLLWSATNRRIRPRIFEPDIPEEITGEELEKSVRAELLSLSAENAKVVARHLVCINIHMDSDPELAHKHGIAAAHHAGRLAVVRESAGYAAYRAGHYEIALKELRAAHRISGDVSMWPVMADCERGMGRPLKALNLAGSDEVKRLAKPEEIEMRIVASGARRDLGELDAAVITLTCKELKTETEEWAVRLRYAYADALASAGRGDEAREWFAKCAEIDHEESTDAEERARG